MSEGFGSPLFILGLHSFGDAPPQPPPAGGASSDYGRYRRRRRIMLPDGRIVTPKSEADYRRIVGRILAQEAPELVEVAAKPVTARKRSRSIGRTEPDYRIDERALAAATRLTEIGDTLSMHALIAELTLKGRMVHVEQEQEDDDTVFWMIAELA